MCVLYQLGIIQIPSYRLEKEQNELVEVIETVTYQICRDDDINVDIFYEVRSMISRLYLLASQCIGNHLALSGGLDFLLFLIFDQKMQSLT